MKSYNPKESPWQDIHAEMEISLIVTCAIFNQVYYEAQRLLEVMSSLVKKKNIWGHYWEHLTICNTVCRYYYSEDMGGGSMHSHELAALTPSVKSDFDSYL